VANAVEARKTGAPAPSRKELAKIVAAEEALLAGDEKRGATMPPGTYDPLLGWITGRADLAALKQAVTEEKTDLKEPGERTAEEGAQLIDQLKAL
jgi:hypothetical protein